MDRTTQGKCEPCGVVFVWPQSKPPLYRALCPRCGRPLERTTYLRRLPVAFETPSWKSRLHQQ